MGGRGRCSRSRDRTIDLMKKGLRQVKGRFYPVTRLDRTIDLVKKGLRREFVLHCRGH